MTLKIENVFFFFNEVIFKELATVSAEVVGCSVGCLSTYCSMQCNAYFQYFPIQIIYYLLLSILSVRIRSMYSRYLQNLS